MRKAEVQYAPTRPLGGWLATWAKLTQAGTLAPTTDREHQVFEAARTLGMVDFGPYLRKGMWNDTHTAINVGIPTSLEYHDETSALAKAHAKVGWWTEGHLFDRDDPRSWTLFGDYEPTRDDLDRSDYFWHVATMLKGLPRTLGLSAEGDMMLSPCGTRIIWAQVRKAAVCETPVNPDASLVPMRLAVPVDRSMLTRSPCSDCRCPPNARCALRKSVMLPSISDDPSDGELVDEREPPERDAEEQAARSERLAQLIVEQYLVPLAVARRWVQRHAAATATTARE